VGKVAKAAKVVFVLISCNTMRFSSYPEHLSLSRKPAYDTDYGADDAIAMIGSAHVPHVTANTGQVRDLC